MNKKKMTDWFELNLKANPVKALEHAYHPPIRYEILKNFLMLPPDYDIMKNSEEAVKKSQRRINLLLTLERTIVYAENLEETDTETVIRITSILKELHFYMCSRRLNNIERSLIYLFKLQQKNGGFPFSMSVNAFIIETIMEYGLSGNVYVQKALRYLLRHQNNDYGWGTTQEGHSDIWLTCKILRAFSLSSNYLQSAKIRKSAEFVLSHLDSVNKGGFIGGKHLWLQFASGFRFEESFQGGILKILEILSRLNYSADDKRVDGILKKLISYQMHSGQWPDQAHTLIKSSSNEKVTICVVRILRLFYIMPERGRGTIRKYKIK